MTQPLYTVGDIHGQHEELLHVLDLIQRDGGADAQIVFLGDYVDRGPSSAQVLDTLIAGQNAGRPWTCLKGNHDRMFTWFMEEYPRHDAYLALELYWLHPRLGGDTTLASYGVKVKQTDRQLSVHEKARAAVPQAHVDFLRNAPLSYETDDHFFAHAGIRPGVPLAQQTEHDLLWIRKQFHAATHPHPKLIIHGHTPVRQATHYTNRINIDAGAGYGHPLAAIVLEGRACWTLSDDGRIPLIP